MEGGGKIHYGKKVKEETQVDLNMEALLYTVIAHLVSLKKTKQNKQTNKNFVGVLEPVFTPSQKKKKKDEKKDEAQFINVSRVAQEG